MEISCPSDGSFLSAYMEYELSALTHGQNANAAHTPFAAPLSNHINVVPRWTTKLR
jgi:hypothetical protein